MKKTLIATVILGALLTTGCEDKETQSKIDQLNQTVAQLTAENTRLKADLTAAKAVIPAVIAEEDVVFKKSESLTYPKSAENEYQPEGGEIEINFSTVKTNLDWFNTLLWNEIAREEPEKNTQESAKKFSLMDLLGTAKGKVKTREQLIADYQKYYDETKAGMLEEPSMGYADVTGVDFVTQNGKLATFVQTNYQYFGGAHGMQIAQYINVDIENRRILQFKDIFAGDQSAKLKELLWAEYAQLNESEGQTPFVEKADFEVTPNIYLAENGVHFVYNVYEIGAYAEGEKELVLDWQKIQNLLSPEFKQNYAYLMKGLSR